MLSIYALYLKGVIMKMKTKATTVPTAQNTPAEKATPFNALLRQPFFGIGTKKPSRNILHYDKVSKTDESAIVSFYDMLVPGDKTRPINIQLIVEEGFPAFENTIGAAEFKKIQKYFGIGCKANKNALKNTELTVLIGKLRTIENAQFYLHEYKSLIKDVAARLHDAPESMNTLEKAKFVRMYYTIFVGYYYFAEDFVFLCRKGKTPEEDVYTIDIDFDKALKNNSLPYYPEELFDQYKKLIVACKPDRLVFDRICYELNLVDKKLFKEILHFAELKANPDGSFESINIVPLGQTFSSIRTIKNRVHPYMGVYPIETFACIERMCAPNFDDMYLLYKICKIMPLEKCSTVKENVKRLEGARITTYERTYYKLVEGETEEDCFMVAGELEVNRFESMVKYMASKGYKIMSSDGKLRDIGLHLAVMNFCNIMHYLDATSPLARELEVSDKLISMDNDGAIFEYLTGKIKEDDLKSRLGIDDAFEKDFFGIEKTVTPEEIVLQFAIDNGYANSSEDVSMELIENVVLLNTEGYFSKYNSEEIDSETLKKRIGFEEDFAEMYFNLAKVDIAAIEAKLLEIKRSYSKKGGIKKSALLIKLYCYLIENQVPCGPKNKAPKRNKGLKPSILMDLIA